MLIPKDPIISEISQLGWEMGAGGNLKVGRSSPGQVAECSVVIFLVLGIGTEGNPLALVDSPKCLTDSKARTDQ